MLSLRWQDVDLPGGRMIVQSPKTEHHEGKDRRAVPISPALRPILEEAWDLAPDKAEYVVGGNYRQAAMSDRGWINCNLRTQFVRILKRAGVEPWNRLFHAMRSSCETEWAAEHPAHVVAAWLGHSMAIAQKHYLLTRDSDFDRASQPDASRAANCAASGAANCAAAAVHSDTQNSTCEFPRNAESPENQGILVTCGNLGETLVELPVGATGDAHFLTT